MMAASPSLAAKRSRCCPLDGGGALDRVGGGAGAVLVAVRRDVLRRRRAVGGDELAVLRLFCVCGGGACFF